MYDTLWQTIQAGGYRLEEMLDRIDVFYGELKLTSKERDQLKVAARANANPEAEYPADWQTPLNALAERVKALEAWRAEQEAAGGEEGGGTAPADEWPEYVAPTGAHDAYYKGDQITYNGKHYTCTAPEGTACVWPPDVYPAYWQEET